MHGQGPPHSPPVHIGDWVGRTLVARAVFVQICVHRRWPCRCQWRSSSTIHAARMRRRVASGGRQCPQHRTGAQEHFPRRGPQWPSASRLTGSWECKASGPFLWHPSTWLVLTESLEPSGRNNIFREKLSQYDLVELSADATRRLACKSAAAVASATCAPLVVS